MSDFWDGVGKKLSEVAGDLERKAGDTIETQKIKSEIRSLERANARDFTDIGRMVYDKFQAGELSSTDYVTICEAVEKRCDEIRRKQEEISRIEESAL